MPVKPPTQSRVLALDADKLGTVAGGFVGLLVAAIQMFYREADPLTTLVRSGWAFVGAYAAVFFLVRTILRTTLFEALAEKAAKREAKREHMRDGATGQVATETPAGGSAAAKT